MGGGITTLGAFRTFTNIPGPGIRTASFAAFGAWSGVLPKNAESLRNSDALMRVAVPRRRGPAGLRDLFTFVEVAACTPCAQSFLCVRGRGGITTLGVLCVLLKRRTAACQEVSFAVLNPGHAGFPNRVKRSEGSDTTPTSHVQKVLRTE